MCLSAHIREKAERFVVFLPTPASAVNSSIVFGTSPPCRASRSAQHDRMLLALARKNPVDCIIRSRSYAEICA
jgi:hypothetical protein